MKSLGQIAYERFLQLEPNNPPWLHLTFAQKRNWEFIAEAVVNAVNVMRIEGK